MIYIFLFFFTAQRYGSLHCIIFPNEVLSGTRNENSTVSNTCFLVVLLFYPWDRDHTWLVVLVDTWACTSSMVDMGLVTTRKGPIVEGVE